MSRLPVPGNDNNVWGNILNDFLDVSHNADGTLQSSAITQAGGVTSVNGRTPVNGGVTLTAGEVGALASGAGAGGDLAGTYPNPTVAKVRGVSVSGTPNAGEVLMASSASAATWGAVAGTMDWINVKSYGAQGDGTTDDTNALQAAMALATAGQTVYFPAGNYFMNSSSALNLTVGGANVVGDGPYATTITLGSSFSAAHVFTISATDCSISRLYINGPGASSGTNFNAIEIGNNLSRIRLSDLYFTNIPGWCIESISGSGGTNSDHMYRSINARSNAGGIHLKASGGSHRECFITDVNCQQQGSGTGSAANLDTFLFEDVLDVLCVNFNSGQTATGTGSAIHVLGSCASLDFVNMDISSNRARAGGAVVTVEQGPNGKPSGISFWACSCQGGPVGAVIGSSGSDQSQKVRFYNSSFANNQTHGTIVQGTGIEITFLNCEWTGNGFGASGTNYDLYWQSTGAGRVEFGHFASTTVLTGTAGVQNNISLPANDSAKLGFWNNVFHDTGMTLSQIFADGNYPAMFFRPELSVPAFYGQLTVQSPFSAPSNTNFRVTSASAGDKAFALDVSGDTSRRLAIDSNGKMQWGPGNAGTDTTLYRLSADNLKTDGAITLGGITGATASSRYAGATTGGPPSSGSFTVGDFVIDQTGPIWVCVVAGTPGSWVQASGILYPSGDTTGVTDTTAINNAFPPHGAAGVILGPGNFYINAPIIMPNYGALIGQGASVTNINMVAGFSGSQSGLSAGIFMNQTNNIVSSLTLQGQSTTITSNANANGIEVLCRHAILRDIVINNINGYAVEYLNQDPTGSFQANTHGSWSNVQGGNCAGGFHLNGYNTNPTWGSPSGDFNGYIAFCGITGVGTTSGPNANLDAFKAEDINYVWTWGLDGSVSAGTGSTIHIYGSGSEHLYGLGDISGQSASSPAVLIESGPNGNSQLVKFRDYIFGGGNSTTCLTLSSTGNDYYFENCGFTGAQTHGVVVSGSGKRIKFTNCQFGTGTASNANGQGASGTNYDLNWSGTATGQVSNCDFGSKLVTTGLVGVQTSINVAKAQNVQIINPNFSGTGTTAANQYANAPAPITSLYAPGPKPSDNGFLAWNYDPITAGTTTGTIVIGGTVYFSAVYVYQPIAFTKINWYNTVVGSGAVAGQNYAGVYNSAGTLLVSAAADSTVTATGLQTVTVTNTTLAAGMYWVAFVFNAGTEPTVWRSIVNTTSFGNINLTASNLRWCTNTGATGLTSLPSTITVSQNVTTNSSSYWVALS